MDDHTCMVDTARFFTEFCVDESCGKCTPCREGLKVMFDKLTNIVEGRGEEGDVEFLQEWGKHINSTSHCGLGKAAANPVLSTIRYFRNEYDAHIRDKHCPSLVCPKLDRLRCHGRQMQDVRSVLSELPIRRNYLGKEAGSTNRPGKMHQMPDLYYQL